MRTNRGSDDATPSRTTLHAIAGPLLAWAFAGAFWIVHHEEPRAAAILDLAEPVAPAPELRFVPTSSPAQSAAQVLERRLTDVEADVETLRGRRPSIPMLELDVTGLAAEIEAILAEVGDAAQMSIHIRDLESDHVLFDYFGDTPLNAASNQKLLTSSAALELLGADYTWTTRVLRADKTLYLVGEGDPALKIDDLRRLAAVVAVAVDLAEIEKLVVDDSAFSRERLGPGYSADGPGWAYEAPSSALSLGFNVVEVMVRSTADRKRVEVATSPASSAVAIRNRARIGRRDSLEVMSWRQGERTVIEVSGRMRRGATPVILRRRVATPSLFAGTVFAELLSNATATEPVPVERGVTPSDAEAVATHESPTMLEILDLGLAYSNNFIAEQLLRTVAWRMTGEPGDWVTGNDILRSYWSAVGGDPHAIRLQNASGLGPDGRLTTTGIVDLLAIAHRTAPRGRSLIDVLPIAGEPGTLHARLRLSGKRVRAKTGTLNHVSALSGVITREDGAPQLAFSILTNARDADAFGAPLRRVIEDRIVMAVLHRLDAYEDRRTALDDVAHQASR